MKKRVFTFILAVVMLISITNCFASNYIYYNTLPNLNGFEPIPAQIPQGKAYYIKGTITSDTPIRKVTIRIFSRLDWGATLNVTECAEPYSYNYNLANIDPRLHFTQYPAGDMEIQIWAVNSSGSKMLHKGEFKIVNNYSNQPIAGSVHSISSTVLPSNNSPKYYDVEQLIIQGTKPFYDYSNTAEKIVLEKDNSLEAWKAVANMSFKDKCRVFLSNSADAFYEEYWKLVFAETLQRATQHQSNNTIVNTTRSYSESLNNGSEFLGTIDEADMKLVRKISQKLDSSVVQMRNEPLLQKWESLFKKYGDKLKTASYATSFFAAVLDSYEENAQYLIAMKEMVDNYINKYNPSYANAMKRAMDYTISQYQDKASASVNTLFNIGLDAWSDKIINSVDDVLKYLGQKGMSQLLTVFQVLDFSSHLLLNLTGFDEKFSASTKSIFMCLIALHFQDEFISIGNKRRSDGFSEEDNQYMRNIFELCRATHYKTYDYFSIQYTDASNQAWINNTKNSIQGRSIKSYLR